MPDRLRNDLPRANVLGVRIHAVDMDTAIQESDRLLAGSHKGYVCLTGVHGVMEAQSDLALANILNDAFLCLPDGMPAVWVGHSQGHRQMSRVYGPDYMLEMCRRSRLFGYRHFLYGGAPGVVEQLKARLQTQMPWLQIVGACTPPYGPLTALQESDLISVVARSKPDIFWVGLSTPKQERFMARFVPRLDVKLMAGVGAAFDLHAGLRPDAPLWMKHSGLQWLHRLAHEPVRLGPRYLRHNPRFVWQILRQTAGRRAEAP